MIIGYYSIANAVTLFGLISAVTSCFLAAHGNFKFAVYMLFLALICDMFDGKIARMNKNRTESQKFYGVQLDSLCDVISFGVTPCFMAFSFGFNGVLDVIIYLFFICCGAIRLAYFNTRAQFSESSAASKTFRGLPIPTSVVTTVTLFMLTTFIPANITVWIFRFVFFGLGFLYILNIKINKMNFKQGGILLGILVVFLLVLVIAGDCKAPVSVKEIGDVVSAVA